MQHIPHRLSRVTCNPPVAMACAALCAALVCAGILFAPQSHAQNQAAGPAGSKTGEKAPTATKPALTVSSVSPVMSPLALRIAANGNVTAWHEAAIGAEVNGLKLMEVRANVGDVVRKGQVLAVFSADTVQADLAQARAALAEAEAAAAEASANAQRASSLKDTGALSAQQITQYATAEKTALARVESAKALVYAAQVRLRNTQVTAPDSGVISARNATVGAVAAGGPELFRLIRQGRLEWRAEVTASEIGKITRGAAVSITAASGAQVQGKVRMVAPSINPQTRNAIIYIDLPPHPDIKAGMFAKGEFMLGSAQALTLPQQALVLRDGFTYAMRLEADNKVRQVKLQTGRRVGDLVEITQGATAGERFVASGAAFLADGDTVRVNTPSNATAK